MVRLHRSHDLEGNAELLDIQKIAIGEGVFDRVEETETAETAAEYDETVKKELAELYNKVGTEKDVTPIITRLQSIYDGIQANSDDYSDYAYYENDIAWYLALAYIKDHNLEKAKEMLKPLADNDVSDAKRLLKDMDGI